MALIVRSEHVLFDDWRHTRSFQFGPNEVKIQQDWEGLGVAGVVWDAAISLSFYLWTHPELMRNKSVLELGAGMGLCSIVVGLLGSSIIATDKPSVIPLLASNLQNNIHNNHCELRNATPQTGHAIARPFDWTNPPPDLITASFDVIIGADLVYDVTLFPLLATVFRRLLRRDNYILLSTRVRYGKDADFIASLSTDYGFAVDILPCGDDRLVGEVGEQHAMVISKIYLPIV